MKEYDETIDIIEEDKKSEIQAKNILNKYYQNNNNEKDLNYLIFSQESIIQKF